MADSASSGPSSMSEPNSANRSFSEMPIPRLASTKAATGCGSDRGSA